MAYKWRDEIVGKRFLCVTTSSKIKVKKINEWNWRQGIIRASNRSHTKHNDLTVLVEYDGVDWRKREWIKVYDQQFHVFLIEYNIVWSTRADTVLGKNKQWLALNFKILVDKVGLRDSQLKPIEYLDDRQLDFVDYNALKLYEDFDLTKDPYKSVSCLQKYIRQWTEYQDSQKILLTTPSVLVGYRVKVYRSEGTTQWYTAVIVSYNENTKELTLTDDTVLEERNEDPTLVQMKLIGDGVVESILKGEEIGITPRRRACNQNSRETTTATSLNNSVTTNNNYANSNARKLTNPSNNNSTNHHPNRVKNSNLVNNLSNINVSSTTTVTTNTSTTTTTSTVNSRVNSHNDNNNNSLTTTTNNCNTNDDNIRINKHINTGNEKEIAVKTNNKSSKHSDSNCIASVMNSSVTKADVNNSNFDSSLKSNYHRFGLDLSDQQAHGLQSKAQKNENQEYQQQQQQQQQANNQDQVNQQQRNTSVRLNNSHNHLGSNFSSVTTTSTTSKTNSQSKSSSASPTSSINSTTYSSSLMHLHMTPSQSVSHLPRPPCPPNGDGTTGPPSTSIASSIHHQQHHQQQQHHLHHQQQQHIQSHHHLSSQPSSSIPKSSASSLDSQNSSTMSRPPPGIISPYSNAIGNYQAMLMLQHQQELLWQKYPEMRGMTASSANPDNRLLTPYQINDWKMIQERERDNRQLQEKMKLEDKMRERLEREAKDRESKERDKFLKERAEKEKKQREAVDQHFVESLRLANQKQRAVTTGWPQMGKGNSGNPNHPPPPQSPVRSQQQSQPAVSSSGNNSLPRSYIPMFNGDAEKESGESKSANSSNCSSRSSSSATSSHQPNNNNVNNNNNNSNNNNSNNNNNNNNNNSNSNNMVHSDARLIRNMEQRHHQQQTPQTPKSQQQSRSGNKVDYRSSESNLSHLHAAAAAQQFSVLSQQQSHSPNGPQHPLHLIHAPSWGVPRSGVSSVDHHYWRRPVLFKTRVHSNYLNKMETPSIIGICHKCGEAVLSEGTGCTAMGQVYHIRCFRCSICNRMLQGLPFYSLDGKPYCEDDYLNTLEKCCVCNRPILDRILRATGKPYHAECFTCTVCGKGLEGIPFTVDSANQLHCIEDFNKKFAPRCSVCDKPIIPEPNQPNTVRVVALDRNFHVSCYKCEDCGLLLSSQAEGRGCYPLDEHILCRNCNARRVRQLTASVC